VTRQVTGPADDLDPTRDARRALLVILVLLALGGPTLHLLGRPLTALGWFQVLGSILLAALVIGTITVTPATGSRSARVLSIGVILPLGIALFVVAGKDGDWIGALAIAGGMSGRGWRTPIPAIIGSVACAAAGLAVAVHYNYGGGNTFSVTLIAPLASFLAYSTFRRIEVMDSLRKTRAELARAAVAEERLRIARDLHDLLGHSLSLITLKAQLAGRVIGTDPDRAVREIGDLESVARQSLSDVRAAVAGFRQPDLSGELEAARQLLDAAGIGCRISSPEHYALPQDVDAALAWAVREGATNVVRHSRATKVTIRVSTTPLEATAEISDNGPAAPEEPVRPPALQVPLAQPVQVPLPEHAASGSSADAHGQTAVARPRPAFGGSGLAGLAERVRSLGGEIGAGRIEPHGFLLRVVVPLPQQA
jgi:two-component system, NarL family, sensor histidine kinase DesK